MTLPKPRNARNPNPMPDLFAWADRQPHRTLPPLPIYGDRTLTLARKYRLPARIAAVFAESEARS